MKKTVLVLSVFMTSHFVVLAERDRDSLKVVERMCNINHDGIISGDTNGTLISLDTNSGWGLCLFIKGTDTGQIQQCLQLKETDGFVPADSAETAEFVKTNPALSTEEIGITSYCGGCPKIFSFRKKFWKKEMYLAVDKVDVDSPAEGFYLLRKIK